MEGIKFEKVSFGTFLKSFENSKYLKSYIDTELKTKGNMTDIDIIKNIYDNIRIPKRKTIGSAGYDIDIPLPWFNINSFEKYGVYILPTGLKAKMPKNIVLSLYPRSSIGIKYNLLLANTVAIIDSDYYNNSDNEGHILVAIKNNHQLTYIIDEMNKNLVQGIFTKYETVEDEEEPICIRNGGLGSTSYK